MKFALLGLASMALAADPVAPKGEWFWFYNNPNVGRREMGFTEGLNKQNIEISVYYDLLCYFSMKMDPIFQTFLKKDYTMPDGSGVFTVMDLIRVNYHFVPLPYHHESWIPDVMVAAVINQCH